MSVKRDGWERASIKYNSRPDGLPPRTTPDDSCSIPVRARWGRSYSAEPRGSRALYLGLTVGLVVAITPVDNLGPWWAWITVLTWFGSWAWLFAAAVRENKANERWLNEQ